jgi:hypothetical protein
MKKIKPWFLQEMFLLDPRFKNFDFKRGTGEMRDKARKYLHDTYLADWAPKSVSSVESTSLRPTVVSRPPKVSRGFLDDTDDEEDEDEDGGKINVLFPCTYAQMRFDYVSAVLHRRRLPLA